MRFGWKRSLDRRLRDNRPAPSDDLVQRIVSEVTPATQPRRRTRLGLAAVASAILAIGLASTGGLGYAASAVSAAPGALKQFVTPTSGGGGGGGGGSSDKVTICHIPPGNPANAHLITISSNGVPAHRAHGDPAPGQPCPAGGPADDQYKDKVLICHVPPGNPANRHEIFVSPSAVPAHLAHGDNLGACR